MSNSNARVKQAKINNATGKSNFSKAVGNLAKNAASKANEATGEFRKRNAEDRAEKSSGYKITDSERRSNELADLAEQSDTPDAAKYALAVANAESRLGEDADENDLRDAIDAEFAQLNPTVTGEEFRGEDNAFVKGVRSTRDAIDGLTEMAGNGIDWLWSRGADALRLVSEDAGDAMDAMVNPETGQVAADMLLDLGLSAIPVVGLPLAVGKNAIQQSENLYEGITGRDDVTGRNLDGVQRGASTLEGLLGIGLSAIPAIGKAKNSIGTLMDVSKAGGIDALENAAKIGRGRAAKTATKLAKEIPGIPKDEIDSIAKEAGKVLKESTAAGKKLGKDQLANIEKVVENRGIPLAEGGADDLIRAYREGVDIKSMAKNAASKLNPKTKFEAAKDYVVNTPQRLSKAKDVLLSEMPSNDTRKVMKYIDRLGDAKDTALRGSNLKSAADNIGNYNDYSAVARKSMKSAKSAATKDAAEKAAEKSKVGKAIDFIKEKSNPVMRTAGNAGAYLGSNVLEGARVTGDPLAFASDIASTAQEGEIPWNDILPMLIAGSIPGSTRLSMRLPSPGGNIGSPIPKVSAIGASQLANWGNITDPQAIQNRDTNIGSIEEYLRKNGVSR